MTHIVSAHTPVNQLPIDMRLVLRQYGFRATASKILLLELLYVARTPICVAELLTCWPRQFTVPNQTTLYRALFDLHTAGVIRRVDLNSGIAHFEYTPNRPHHHHIVCLGCGLVEETEHCSVGPLEQKIVQESTQFMNIKTHNLEFFGHCIACQEN